MTCNRSSPKLYDRFQRFSGTAAASCLSTGFTQRSTGRIACAIIAAMDDEKPRRKFGPTKGELRFWLVASLAGFAMMAAALLIHGVPWGPGLIEIVLIPGLFLGWLFVRSVLRLRSGDYPPG